MRFARWLMIALLSSCAAPSSAEDEPEAQAAVPVSKVKQMTLAGTPSAPGQYQLSMDRPEGQRNYWLYVPTSYVPRPQTPVTALQSSSLVVILHGGGGSGSGMIGSTKFNAKADAERVVVAYPDGTSVPGDTKLMWNAGLSPSPTPTTVDDVGFLRALIDKLSHDLNIDRKRVYVAGFSNGSMMTYRLATLLPGRIAAIAALESAIGVAPIPAPGAPPSFQRLTPADATGKISVLMIHCKGDHSVPYLGGIGGSNPAYWPPLHDAVHMWTVVDNCNAANKVTSMEGTTHVLKFPNCGNGTEVKRYLVEGGTHFWAMPGAPQLPPGTTFTFNATDVVWDFFKSHGKP